ncbi:MAG: NAD-dependent epimerase/dehydratase family protein [Halodesulfurarchaeum sp.]
MTTALLIGGTRFIGRHTVSELLAHGYDVTLFTRGNRPNPFADDDRVDHVEGDRTNDSALEAAASTVDPDVVIDTVAYKPREVETATRIFSDVDAYVYVSSGAAYADEEIPKREGMTRLHECSDEQAVDDDWDTYGNRKAEGDRACFRAADRGVNAMVVRPPVVYGPHDYTDRFDYWLQRVDEHDRVVVPGDGTNVWHRVFVADVAKALRVVAEEGTPGEAYNVGDGDAVTLERMVRLVAGALDTDVEVVHAGERELGVADLTHEDFPLYRSYPHLLAIEKLRDLGWEPTPVDAAISQTAEAYRERDRTDLDRGPSREAEERVLEVLGTI